MAVEALRVLLSRIPLSSDQLKKAEVLVASCTADDLAALGLSPPPRPVVPHTLDKLQPRQRLQAIQRIVSSLTYNHANGYNYNVSKSRPFSRIMDTAREVLREALPIKCIEAVFLGAHLTCGWAELDRMPIGFKSRVKDQEYRHIILAVYHQPSRKFGALGISRRAELMDKDLVYDSLSELMADYKASYERWWHCLSRIRVGLPLEHDAHYAGAVCWRHMSLAVEKHPWSKCARQLDEFTENARKLREKFRAGAGALAPDSGRTPEPTLPTKPIRRHTARSVSPCKRRPPAAGAAEQGTSQAPLVPIVVDRSAAVLPGGAAAAALPSRRASDPGGPLNPSDPVIAEQPDADLDLKGHPSMGGAENDLGSMTVRSRSVPDAHNVVAGGIATGGGAAAGGVVEDENDVGGGDDDGDDRSDSPSEDESGDDE